MKNDEYSKNIIDTEQLEKDLYDFLNNHIKRGDN